MKASLAKANDIIRYGPDAELKNAFHEEPIVVFDPKEKKKETTSSSSSSSSSALTSPKSITEQFAPMMENIVKAQAQETKMLHSAFTKELETVTKNWQQMFQQALKSQHVVDTSSSFSSSTYNSAASPSKGSLSQAQALDEILIEREKAVQQREKDVSRRDAALTKQFEALEARERKMVDMERSLNSKGRELEAARISLENGRLDLVEKMTEANTYEYEKNLESFVSLGEKIADSIPRKKAQLIGTNVICLKFISFFEKKKSIAFNLWRSGVLKQKTIDKDLDLEKLKEEVVDSHGRENEIVSLLQVERRRAQDEQSKLHSAVRAAETEKQEAIVRAEEEISQTLRKQVEVMNNAVNSKISAGTSTTKSIEIASLRQSYQEKEMQLQMQLQLEKQQQQREQVQLEDMQDKQKKQTQEIARRQSENESKLVEILPEDLLRHSNEEMLLSQAMSRIRRSSVSKVNTNEIQDSLAKEIKEKF